VDLTSHTWSLTTPDKEGEYISNEFAKFCEQKGTILLPTHPNIIEELRERIKAY
jgi:hypothetical protein